MKNDLPGFFFCFFLHHSIFIILVLSSQSVSCLFGMLPRTLTDHIFATPVKQPSCRCQILKNAPVSAVFQLSLQRRA